MARVFLTSNLKTIGPDGLQGMMEMILQELEDQINASPSIASLVNTDDPLPKGMRKGDVIFNIQNGELKAGVYNGVDVLYASFGSFVGAITDAQHGTRAGGNLHPDATTTIAGFMPVADKVKTNSFKGFISDVVPPSVTHLPTANDWCYFTDTTGPTYYLAANFGGSIKTTLLT